MSMTRSSPAVPRKRQTSTAALRGRNSSPAPAPGAGATASEGSYGGWGGMVEPQAADERLHLRDGALLPLHGDGGDSEELPSCW